MNGTYLIFEGDSGIGLAVAKKLSYDGSQVIIVDGNKEKLAEASKEIGSNCISYFYDLGDIEHINLIFDFVISKKIRLNGMIFCADICPLVLLNDCTPEIARHVFRMNVFSFIECAKFFYDERVSYDGSKIVVLTSTAAHKAENRRALYGSSKSAIIAATRLMAKELLNRNIKVNCISPGVVKTEILSDLNNDKNILSEQIISRQPLGVIPTEKAAELICVLVSSLSDYMTGIEIIYDGGSMLR
ncbi:diacetyl reductase [(S)-acetoin forming] [Lachnospiraceae bacterium]|nr:diacetyl reductase [(S)-acetoin forming] [Lachnospiraceae bacterium]